MIGQVNSKRTEPRARDRRLPIGDAITLAVFGLIGRGTHELSNADLYGALTSFMPFVISWFAVAPWFGLFQTEVVSSISKTASRLAMSWIPIGFPIGLLLWALVRGRAIPDGISVPFAIAAWITTTVFLLIWRIIYIQVSLRNEVSA